MWQPPAAVASRSGDKGWPAARSPRRTVRAPIYELPLPAVGHRVGMETPGPEAKVPVLSPPSGPRDSWGGWEQHATHRPIAQPLSHLGSQVCSAHHLLCPSPA